MLIICISPIQNDVILQSVTISNFHLLIHLKKNKTKQKREVISNVNCNNA